MSVEKFKILMWKNWIIVKRNYKSAIFEIVLPIIFVVIFNWTRNQFLTDESGDNSFAITFLPMILVFSLFYSVSNAIKVSIEASNIQIETKNVSRVLQLNVKVS